jgi:hypothetical protein
MRLTVATGWERAANAMLIRRRLLRRQRLIQVRGYPLFHPVARGG